MLREGKTPVGKKIHLGVAVIAVGAAVYAAKGTMHSTEGDVVRVPGEALDEAPAQSIVPTSLTFAGQGAERVVLRYEDNGETSRAAEPRPPKEGSHFRATAMQLKQGRQNVFFNESAFLQEFIQGGAQNMTALRDELSKTDDLNELPSDTAFMQDRPEVALERMAMVDLLVDAAESDGEAFDALVDLVLMPVDNTLSEIAKKELVGEKFDLLVALVQMDRQAALNVYARISSSALKTLLRPALLKGLFEAGIAVEAAEDMIAEL